MPMNPFVSMRTVISDNGGSNPLRSQTPAARTSSARFVELSDKLLQLDLQQQSMGQFHLRICQMINFRMLQSTQFLQINREDGRCVQGMKTAIASFPVEDSPPNRGHQRKKPEFKTQAF